MCSTHMSGGRAAIRAADQQHQTLKAETFWGIGSPTTVCVACLADVYMLLTGNRAIGTSRNMANQARTGIYMMPRGGSTWTPLRGKVSTPHPPWGGCKLCSPQLWLCLVEWHINRVLTF